ncbi:MAG: FAD-dependent oxidoreductase, partial [Pseudomonadota bacterium]
PADSAPIPFSYLTEEIQVPQVTCGITYTTPRVHEIIAENIAQSAVYSGAIAGRGPRYCPSIEDKVHRFAEKTRHQIFLEPEGLDDSTVYPNGISTSLPREIQDQFVREIPGLEAVEIIEYGYAIEYDYVDPRALGAGLQVKAMSGLFLAGQINGTTGYEEAGAQGLVAGLNAVRLVRGQAVESFDRAEAYIGVMIDDLITRGVTEPYRMFTSRAEYRLSLRSDNADQRLTPRGAELGLVGAARGDVFHVKQQAIQGARSALQSATMTPSEAQTLGWKVNQDGQRRSAWDYLAYPDIDMAIIEKGFPIARTLAPRIRDQVEIEAMYAGYIERQKEDVAVLRREDSLLLPSNLDYGAIGGLSNEVRGKLEQVRPATLGQAARIEGVTPGALTALLAFVRRRPDRKRKGHG